MKNRWSVILLILVLVLIYWQWWLLGPRVTSDFSLISDSTLKSLLDFPRAWSDRGAEGLGEYSVFTLWSWPINLILGILSNLGLTFNFLERLVFIIPILFIGGLGIWKICQSINLPSLAKVVSIILYSTNTYLILLIDGGQLSIALAYSFLPVSFLTIQKAISEGLKKKILSGLTVSILGFFDFRFIFVLLLLTLIYFLYELLFLNRNQLIFWFVKGIKAGLLIGLIIAGVHAYWLLPLYRVPLSPQIYQQLINNSGGGFTNIGHALTLLSPHWFKNIFGNITTLKWEFIPLPILVFLAPILKPKSKVVGFWTILAILSIFLSKGTNPPVANIYSWLFTDIPGFSLFRDSTKFFSLLALSYSILIGMTFDQIQRRIQKKWVKKWIGLIVILYLVMLIGPVWTGEMGGTFSSSSMQDDYEKVGQIIQADNKFSRIFWIPSVAPLGYSDPTHPWVEAARLYQRRPFAIGVKGTYELFNFLRESPYMGQIFDISSIGYIGYPYLNQDRGNLHPDNIKYYYDFSDQLSKLPWLSKVNESPIPVWRINTHQDRFFITPNVWWVIGSDDIYQESTTGGKLVLSKNALIFVEEQAGLGKQIDDLGDIKIILNHKTQIDLAASFIDSQNIFFPSQQLKYDPDQSGWWKRDTKDFIHFKDFLATKYGVEMKDFDLGGGWVIGEGNLELRINNRLKVGENGTLKKNNILLIRVLESTRSGQLRFYQADTLISQIDTQKLGDNIRWFEVGHIPTDNQTITVQSQGDINIVNALAILDRNIWDSYKKKALDFSTDGRIVDFDEKNSDEILAKVSYQKIDPTKYLVKVKDGAGSFLIFSQSFHPLWKLDGRNSLPVYSLLNGFKIEKDGEYLVEFEPQRYVYQGLIISAATFLLIITVLIIPNRNKVYN